MKICLISSSGGHLEQLLMLKPLIEKYDGFIVSEKTDYTISINKKTYFLKQVNRNEFKFLFFMLINFCKSLKIYILEKPDVVISTGALSTIPMCLIAKIFRRKLIFIESFAKINSNTLTGKFLYPLADQFYVQWEDMLHIYPKAIFKGGIY